MPRRRLYTNVHILGLHPKRLGFLILKHLRGCLLHFGRVFLLDVLLMPLKTLSRYCFLPSHSLFVAIWRQTVRVERLAINADADILAWVRSDLDLHTYRQAFIVRAITFFILFFLLQWIKGAGTALRILFFMDKSWLALVNSIAPWNARLVILVLHADFEVLIPETATAKMYF